MKFRATPGAGWAAALVLFALAPGCQPREGSAGPAVQPPAGWQRMQADQTTPAAPGTVLAAWSGPQGARLVVYHALPNPGGTAASLAQELATRLANLPQLAVVAKRVEQYGGREAARVEAVAPGDGSSLAPSGTGVPVATAGPALVATRQVSVGFVQPAGVIWLTWYYPESAQAELAPQVEQTLRSLRLGAAS